MVKKEKNWPVNAIIAKRHSNLLYTDMSAKQLPRADMLFIKGEWNLVKCHLSTTHTHEPALHNSHNESVHWFSVICWIVILISCSVPCNTLSFTFPSKKTRGRSAQLNLQLMLCKAQSDKVRKLSSRVSVEIKFMIIYQSDFAPLQKNVNWNVQC